MTTSRRIGTARGRWQRVLSFVGVLLLGIGAGWWAAHVATAPGTDEGPATLAPSTAEVVESTVGLSIPMGAAAVQTFEQVATNGLAGVVTSVGSGEVSVGDPLYSVGATPARAVVGDTPFWRPLTAGTRGVDVRQLQQALIDLGYLDAEADGVYGSATRDAVRSWQRASGSAVTGTVPLGEVIAVPRLPDAVRLGTDIVLGSVLAGGEPAVLARAGDPTFEMTVTPEQAQRVPEGAAVRLTLDAMTWDAVAAGATVTEDGVSVIALAAPGGGPVCGETCSAIPPDARTLLRAEVEAIPAVTGPSVPLAAVTTDAAGDAHVTLSDGRTAPVEILGSEGGVAVVSGVDIGSFVMLPGPVSAPADGEGP